MAREVKVSILVSDDGTMRLTEKSAKKLGTSMDRVGKSAATADRSLKGAAQASSNTTKNFSKMAQGITGGLVPAYATFAANVFAITAVFQAFRVAADVTNLIEGQKTLGGVTGVAYGTITKNVREATEGMLGFKEAASATAIGISAGLSASQLERLAEAAKTSSAALGRDLTDSFNRLVRGVTKAEPELLDELGIVLRLEDATQKYADALGITGRKLTTFEKQQAVANEVLTQAEQKYGKIAEIIDPAGQAINRLGASFDQLLIPLQRGVTQGLAPFFDFLSDNLALFGTVLTAAGLSIVKAFTPGIPAIKNIATAAETAREALVGIAIEQSETGRKILETGKINADQLRTLEKAARSKTSTVIDLNQMESKEIIRNIRIVQAQERLAQAEREVGIKRLVAKTTAGYSLMTAAHGAFVGAALFGFRLIALAASALPYVALIGLLVAGGKALYNFFNPIPEEIKKANDAAKSLSSTLDSLNNDLDNIINIRSKINQTLTDIAVGNANALQSADIVSKLVNLQELERADPSKKREAYEKLKTTFEKLVRIVPELRSFNKELENISKGKVSDSFIRSFAEVQNRVIETGAALKRWPDTMKTVNDEFKKLFSVREDPFVKFGSGLEAAIMQGSLSMASLGSATKAQKTELEQLKKELGKPPEITTRREKRVESSGFLGLVKKVTYEQVETEEAKQFRTRKERIDFLTKQVEGEAKEREKIAKTVKRYGLLLQASTRIVKVNKDLAQQTANIEVEIAKNKTLGITFDQKLTNLSLDRDALKASELKKQQELNSATEFAAQIANNLSDFEEGALEAALKKLDQTAAELIILEAINKLKGKQITQNEELIRQQRGLLSFTKAEADAALRVAQANRTKNEIQAKYYGFERARLEQVADGIILEERLAEAKSKLAKAEQVLKNATSGRVEVSEAAIQQAQISKDQANSQIADINSEIKIYKARNDIFLNNITSETQLLQAQIKRMSLNPVQQAYYDLELQAKKEGIVLTDRIKSQLMEEAKAQTALKETIEAKRAVMDSFTSSLQEGISGIIQGTMSMKQAFASMAKSVLQSLAQVLAKMIAIKIIQSTIGFFSGGSSAAASSSSNISVPQGQFTQGLQAGGNTGLFGTNLNIMGSPPGGRNGGVFSNGSKMGGYSSGGIAKGSTSGYPAILHGTEAVVPLPDGKSIPVSMEGSGNTNNVTVNVSMDNQGNSQTQAQSDGQQGANIGKLIAGVVQEELQRQKRPGGILSPYGAAS